MAFTLLTMHKRPADPPDSQAPLGLVAIAAAAALWAVAATVARRLFDEGMDPLELVEARSWIAAAGLALVPGAWKAKGGSGDRRSVVAMGIAIALVNAAYYTAIDRLPVAVAIVLQYSAPAAVVAYAALVYKRKPSPQMLVAVVVTFVGVVLVSELPQGDLSGIDAFGLLMGLGAALFFASYTLISERAAAGYGSFGALLRGFAVASLFWVLFQIPRGFPGDLFESENIPDVLFVGVFGTLVPFVLYIWGVQRVRAERAAVAATLEPVLAALVAWLWLDQVLSPMQLFGGAMIVAAVLSLQVRQRKAAPVEP